VWILYRFDEERDIGYHLSLSRDTIELVELKRWGRKMNIQIDDVERDGELLVELSEAEAQAVVGGAVCGQSEPPEPSVTPELTPFLETWNNRFHPTCTKKAKH
jgi:hypothetical protein